MRPNKLASGYSRRAASAARASPAIPNSHQRQRRQILQCKWRLLSKRPTNLSVLTLQDELIPLNLPILRNSRRFKPIYVRATSVVSLGLLRTSQFNASDDTPHFLQFKTLATSSVTVVWVAIFARVHRGNSVRLDCSRVRRHASQWRLYADFRVAGLSQAQADGPHQAFHLAAGDRRRRCGRDCPFLPWDLVRRFHDARAQAKAGLVVAQSGDQRQPVARLWPAILGLNFERRSSPGRHS
jgi:hypothetical protein